MTALVTGNPGAAAWVIKQSFRDKWDLGTKGAAKPPPQESAARFLLALRTWAKALGALSSELLPPPAVSGAVRVGVADGDWLVIAFSTTPPSADEAVELPPIDAYKSAEWDFAWSTSPSRTGNIAWPWTVLQAELTKNVVRTLKKNPHLGAPDGIWAEDWAYDVAQRISKRRSGRLAALPSADILRDAQELSESLGPNGALQTYGRVIHFLDVQWLISWINAKDAPTIQSGLPGADLTQSSSGMYVWDQYSPKRLMEFEVEVYGRACEAYDEALANIFGALSWSMPRAVLAPFGILLEVLYQDDGSGSGAQIPGITTVRIPMALMDELAPTGPDAIWSSNRRAVVVPAPEVPDGMAPWERYREKLTAVSDWLSKRGDELITGVGVTFTTADDMVETRSSSAVAVNWLHKDLSEIGLAEGSAPNFRP